MVRMVRSLADRTFQLWYYHTGWMGELFHMCQDEYAIGKATAQLDFCSHHDGCSFRISPALTTPKNSGIYDIIRHLHPQFSKISQTQHQDMQLAEFQRSTQNFRVVLQIDVPLDVVRKVSVWTLVKFCSSLTKLNVLSHSRTLALRQVLVTVLVAH